MVRSGSRPGQFEEFGHVEHVQGLSTVQLTVVLSAGKHTGPAKLTNGRKWTHLRTIPRFNADSGYPTHSDSGSQTETTRGLDGCASLLQNILRNEDSGSEIACSENRCNPRRFEGKRHRSKRKGHEKRTVPSLVRKNILPSDYKKQVPNGTPVGRERNLPDIPQNWSFQDHYRMYSPIIYEALCEHVQTQMSLMNDSASKNKPNGIPVVSCHTVSGSESQATPRSSFSGCASSPVQSPQPPACPLVVHSEVQTDGDNQFASQRQTVSASCADRLRNSFCAGLGVQCSPPPTDKAPSPAFQQLGLAKGILPQEVPKEPDLLKCLQTYMTLLCSHSDSQIHRSPTLLQPAFLATNEDSCAREPVGEVTSEEKDLNICVRDPRIKGVQKADSGNQSAEKVRTIRYLLGELKALVAEQEDSEVQRLITELEACVSLLPAASGNRNIQVEVALALQPLRGENAQLRRQLRFLNQQLREQGKTKKTSGSQECDLELFSLQSLNKSLQNQLQESLKSQESLQSKNEELLKVIENQNDENKKFAGIFKEKDQTILEYKQQFDMETTRIKIELEEAVVNLKSCQFKLEAAEKENQILGITLRQRDAEVTRLRDLTRTLQGSMAKLLSDLSVDAARRRPGSGLTTSLLSAHEKQPQHERVPARASILSYLRRVEPGPAGTAALWERDSEEDGGHAAPVEGGCDPGSAVDAPCARSASRRKSPPSKGLSLRPAPLLGSDGGSQARAPRARSSGKEAGDAPEAPSRADTEHGQLLRQVKDAVRRSPAVAEGRSPRCQVGSSVSDGSFLRSDWTSDWSASSFSTFTSRDEQDFRSGLAALDANIARLQESLRSGPPEK